MVAKMNTTPVMQSPRTLVRDEDGKVKIMFFPGCLIISVVGTILLNVLIRAFT